MFLAPLSKVDVRGSVDTYIAVVLNIYLPKLTEHTIRSCWSLQAYRSSRKRITLKLTTDSSGFCLARTKNRRRGLHAMVVLIFVVCFANLDGDKTPNPF